MRSQRVIDRALREWREELAQEFAAQTAALVEAESHASSDRMELWLQRALIVALIIAAIVAVALVGGPALADLASLVGRDWIYPTAVCFGLSLAIQRWIGGPSPSR